MKFTIMNMNSLKKNIFHSVLGALLIGTMASCSEEGILSPEPDVDGVEGGIAFRCSDMLETFVGDNNTAGTRAAESKNPEEKAINTLHVFFFDYDTHKLIDTDLYDNFRSYQKVKNTSFIKIPTSSKAIDNKDFEEFKSKFRRVHIVAIANIDATDEATTADDDKNSFKTKYSDGKIQLRSREIGGEPYEIKDYSDLLKWVYYPRIRMNEDGTGNISKLPDAGMPMIGELGSPFGNDPEKPVDFFSENRTTPIVNMIALMAKVNVSVKLDPDQYTNEYPYLKITNYGVRNMPIAVPFRMPTGGVNEGYSKGKPNGYEDYFNRYDVTNVDMFHKGDSEVGSTHFECDDEAHEFMTAANVTINKNSADDAATFTYYTFENINLPDYNAKRANGANAFDESLNPQYPVNVKDADKERWKSTFAYSDRASALILKGEYTTHQGLTYKAQFTVYMGCTVGVKDPNIDFMVKRNHQYDNNIVIHGLDYIRNSDDEVYNFDGRVNVYDENPFYLAIVNERKVDAHATALPMDVWFMEREDGTGKEIDEFEYNSQITVTIPDDCGWVRMLMVPRDEMKDGGFKPGTGIEKYFYDNMLSLLDDKSKPLLKNHYDGAQCGKSVTIECSPELNNSRSRIYFYIDENVPQSNSDPNYGDRKVKVKIEYTTDNTEIANRTRYIEIEQRALLRVVTTYGNQTHVSWMEVYEEYLDHNDPLDPHNEYGDYYKDGLPWGLENENVYSNFDNDEVESTTLSTNTEKSFQVYTKVGGFKMTKWVVADLLKDSDPLSNVKLFNEDRPSSAFHYCFGKNKRNNDGSAVFNYNRTYRQGFLGTYVTGNDAKGWYMPGITELEKALTVYYNEFPDFRGNYYWSAACAEKSSDYNESNMDDHARATRIIVNGNNSVDYAKSHPRHKENRKEVIAGPGWQTRDNKNRIRAFYRVD